MLLPVCLLWLIVPAVLHAAAPEGLELEVVPQSLELGPCGKDSSLFVIARNQGKSTAANLQLTLLTDLPLEIAPKPDVRTLVSLQQTSWQFNVRCVSEFPAGSLHVVLSGDLAEKNNGQALRQIVTKSITVKLREPQALESVAAIDIKSTLESLTDSDKGEIVVIVSNKTSRPITVSIAPTAPLFIKLTPSPAGPQIPEKEIEGLRTETFTFIASANGRVRPGKQLLMFKVRLLTDPERDYLITREVSVGVIGQSEILKLLGVPSFFLLPGFLALSSFQLLWGLLAGKFGGSKDPPWGKEKETFWLIAVTASLAISSLFLLWRRDVFSFYSLFDVMVIWWISITIGALCYLAIHLWRIQQEKKQKAQEEQLEQAMYPQPGDSPLLVLRKMKDHQLTLDRPRVKVKDLDMPFFELYGHEKDGSVYVCPQMVLIWERSAPGRLRDAVQEVLDQNRDPGALAALLDSARQSDGSLLYELKWMELPAGISHPQKIAKDGVEKRLEVDLVVKQEERQE
ncbi:MAG TPA: hypothetical protein VN872_06505 [Candidatus Acidoferrum sp.]|nr:hypothetical protein [Candidatus Acidoferrum sp.]